MYALTFIYAHCNKIIFNYDLIECAIYFGCTLSNPHIYVILDRLTEIKA